MVTITRFINQKKRQQHMKKKLLIFVAGFTTGAITAKLGPVIVEQVKKLKEAKEEAAAPAEPAPAAAAE